MHFTKKDCRVEACYFDGKLIGERGDDGKVIPRTCPNWFPALARQCMPTPNALPGELFETDAGLHVVVSPGHSTLVEPHTYIVRGDNGELEFHPAAVFEANFEPEAVA